MSKTKRFRAVAIAQLKKYITWLEALQVRPDGNIYTESDRQTDHFIRLWQNLASRPVGTLPYEALFSLPLETVINAMYYSQRDNYREADRTCFASTCAMLLKHLLPDSIKNDDDYIRRVFEIGDTTVANVQVLALASFGLAAKFNGKANYKDILDLLNRGIPVPIGFLHHGTDQHPTGGGHWSLVVGETATDWILHDPWGDLNSGYTITNGKFVRYNKAAFKKRFLPYGKDCGWLISI